MTKYNLVNRAKKASVLLSLASLVAAIGILMAITYLRSAKSKTTLVFSNNTMLTQLWQTAKQNQIEPSTGRTLDKSRDNMTTSEGQSYTMLRAVWMDDHTTFDKSWQWTKDILQHKQGDALFAWQFGKLAGGEYGIRSDIGGQNAASDADGDIALALVMAASRWQDSKYLAAAKPIINDIWRKEVANVNGKPVLTANDLENNPAKPTALVNVSYFSPAAYKLFAKVDPAHDWAALAANSYSVIQTASAAKLDKGEAVGLPPNWISMNKQTGAITPASGQDTDYGYDADRTAWRLGLDWEWNKDARAKTTLGNFKFLGNQWQQDAKLATVYAHDGSVVGNYESPQSYGANIAYFMVTDPAQANSLYNAKLKPLYDANKQSWKYDLNYYDDNWAWFGIALHQHALPNLTEN